MGGTCSDTAANAQIASAVLTIPQTIATNNITGTITYNYHNHSDSCKRVCGSTSFHWETWSYPGLEYPCAVCNSCGTGYSYAEPAGGCKNTLIVCGYSEGQLLSATIKY